MVVVAMMVLLSLILFPYPYPSFFLCYSPLLFCVTFSYLFLKLRRSSVKLADFETKLRDTIPQSHCATGVSIFVRRPILYQKVVSILLSKRSFLRFTLNALSAFSSLGHGVRL